MIEGFVWTLIDPAKQQQNALDDPAFHFTVIGIVQMALMSIPGGSAQGFGPPVIKPLGMLSGKTEVFKCLYTF
jgi:hypothetical protein